MTRWARITWQVADPASFARALASRLGVEVRPGGHAPGALSVDLGTGWLEVRAWVRESPADDPLPGGRLMLEPVPGGEPTPEDVDPAAVRPMRLAGTGWATVELDRAESELSMWLAEEEDGPSDADRSPGARTDPHLGALARVRSAGGLPGDAFVILEPNTEGRLGASLARDGEGPCALYLVPDGGVDAWATTARERGDALAVPAVGPLGPQVLLLGDAVAGPHLLLVDPARVPKRNPGAGTIGR